MSPPRRDGRLGSVGDRALRQPRTPSENPSGPVGYGFPVLWWRHRPPGVDGLHRWRSPLRGPWLTSVFGLVLLVTLPVVILTGLLSYAAYGLQCGQALPVHVGWLRSLICDWPSRPVWLYRVTHGLHVGQGLVLIPVLLAKLWSVIPRLFARPPWQSLAQVLERLSIVMRFGAILFEIATGVLHIRYDCVCYVYGFSFFPAHYPAASAFISGFVVHVIVKMPRMISARDSTSVRNTLCTSRSGTRAEPPDLDGLVAADPAAPTMGRRLMLTVSVLSYATHLTVAQRRGTATVVESRPR